METVCWKGWLVKTFRQKKMILQKEGFQRKRFPVGNIKWHLRGY